MPAEMRKVIKVGYTAQRDPATREFLPARALYTDADEETMASYDALIQDLAKLLAQRLKEYVDAGDLRAS